MNEEELQALAEILDEPEDSEESVYPIVTLKPETEEVVSVEELR